MLYAGLEAAEHAPKGYRPMPKAEQAKAMQALQEEERTPIRGKVLPLN